MGSVDDSVLTLERQLGMELTKKNLYAQAFIHRSYTNEIKARSEPVISYKRLAFLGDAVIELAVREHYFSTFQAEEGELSAMCDKVVEETALAGAASRLQLGELLRLGKGEQKTGGKAKPSILAESFEALFGALFLDFGFEKTSVIVKEVLIRS